WGHEIERCLAGKAIGSSGYGMEEEALVSLGALEEFRMLETTIVMGEMIGKLVHVRDGAQVSSRAGRGCEEWHVVASKRNGPMGSVIKSAIW
ncbi:hypothetical protein Dimus_037778, partial [Dionaea muscipula]